MVFTSLNTEMLATVGKPTTDRSTPSRTELQRADARKPSNGCTKPLELLLKESVIERGVVRDQNRLIKHVCHPTSDIAEGRGVTKVTVADAVKLDGRRSAAPWIDERLELLQHLTVRGRPNHGDLHDAVLLREASRLNIDRAELEFGERQRRRSTLPTEKPLQSHRLPPMWFLRDVFAPWGFVTLAQVDSQRYVLAVERSLVDVALSLPAADALVVRSSLPVGLLDRVEFQPHLGVGRDRLFTTQSADGRRRVALRVTGPREPAAYAFVPCTDVVWVEMLNGSSVELAFEHPSAPERGVLAELLSAADDSGAGSWKLTSVPLAELATRWAHELERIDSLSSDDSERKLPTSLRFKVKKPRDPSSFSDELRGSFETAMRYAPSAIHKADQGGGTLAAYGQFVTSSETDREPARVFVYDGPSLARVAVALAAASSS